MGDVRDNGVDFEIENHGSIVLVRPLTDAAKEFAKRIGDGNTMRFAGALVVEPRFVPPIIEGIEADGLTVGLF